MQSALCRPSALSKWLDAQNYRDPRPSTIIFFLNPFSCTFNTLTRRNWKYLLISSELKMVPHNDRLYYLPVRWSQPHNKRQNVLYNDFTAMLTEWKISTISSVTWSLLLILLKILDLTSTDNIQYANILSHLFLVSIASRMVLNVHHSQGLALELKQGI